MQTKNLGYDKDHVVVLPISAQMKENFENIENAFARVPGVESISASYETPENIQWGDGITAVTGQGEKSISLNALPVDLNFAKTMKMQMLAGRDFIKSDFAMMDTSDNLKNYRQPYIINETLAEKLGWTPEEAIGKTISKSEAGPIVGVVKDFNFSSLHDPIGPLLIFLGRDYSHDFLVRISGNNISQTISRLENAWKNRVNDKPFEYHFLDSDYNNLYLAEQRDSLLFSVAAALAVLLACLGLFGLAAFTTVRRTKEIGIRRVLGADVSSITLLIGKGFLQLVGIAIIVAFPIAWWASNEWLRDFAYRIPLNPLVFALTGVGTAAIALLTVSYHSVKTSLISTVKSLKVE